MLRRCALIVLLVLPALAHGQVQFNVKPQFRPGERISIDVTPAVPIAGIEATLERDGNPVTVKHGPAKANELVHVVLPGAGHYAGDVVVLFRDGNRYTQKVAFDAVVAGGSMNIGYSKDHLDVAAHSLEFTLTRPAGHAELRVVGDDGSDIGTGSAQYHGERAGTWLPIQWTQAHPGNVLKLELTATSSDGVTVRAKLTPWQVAVPHEEVVFETGKANIRPSEEAKLDASYKKIVDAVAAVRKVEPTMAVKLFIAGHTDTVGNTADNRKLSLERARAIGAWFRDRGLPLPIAYAGFGEEALKVKTPDNTDNAANRRADYIVAADEPTIPRGVHATWMKLQ
jgi:outer membrane protein OmpA-like peptidoglycan-associated protein